MKHSRLSTKIIIAFTAIILASAAITSCASTPQDVPANATEMEIIQMAQNAYEAGKEETAIMLYETLIMRYGSDIAIYVEAKYEIAHIYLKQKRYSEAAAIDLEILDIYASLQPGQIPEAYRKMAQNDLAKIPADKLVSHQ